MSDRSQTNAIPTSPTIGMPSPLMRPVTIHGLDYLTSQRLHADYIRNATERKEQIKYTRHDSFSRVIRDIPNYDILLDQKDIIYLSWKECKANNDAVTRILRYCFEAGGHRPLLLLTATAQLELAHHLDDELNREIAYRHSQAGAQAEASSLQGVIRSSKAEFVPKFQGLIAGHLNALNARTKAGALKLPDDVGSPRVAGIVPNRIREGYEAILGEETYAEAKDAAKRLKAQATQQVIEDLPLDMMRGMMFAFAISATSEQHYTDLMQIATGQKQLSMPFRWPLPPAEGAE
jgi:hypothetical protein